MFHTAYIALGANLGDRDANLRGALDALKARGVMVEAVSSFIETDPVDAPPGTESQKYLNGAARVRTVLPPRALLDLLLEVERDLGRTRTEGERNAPRTADLDLLLYDDLAFEEEGLCLPHPRMTKRAFVLKPLAEVAPDLVHPVEKRTIAELLAALGDNQP